MFVKVRSWHIVDMKRSSPNRQAWITLCGQNRMGLEATNGFPLTDKSCESCLRFAKRRHNDARPTA